MTERRAAHWRGPNCPATSPREAVDLQPVGRVPGVRICPGAFRHSCGFYQQAPSRSSSSKGSGARPLRMCHSTWNVSKHRNSWARTWSSEQAQSDRSCICVRLERAARVNVVFASQISGDETRIGIRMVCLDRLQNPPQPRMGIQPPSATASPGKYESWSSERAWSQCGSRDNDLQFGCFSTHDSLAWRQYYSTARSKGGLRQF